MVPTVRGQGWGGQWGEIPPGEALAQDCPEKLLLLILTFHPAARGDSRSSQVSFIFIFPFAFHSRSPPCGCSCCCSVEKLIITVSFFQTWRKSFLGRLRAVQEFLQLRVVILD